MANTKDIERNMPDRYRKAMAEFSDEVKKARDEEILALYEDFAKGDFLESNRKLPINLFEEHFLDLFMGNIKDPKVVEERRIRWIDVAGHAGRPVDIIDLASNKVLFTIPAMSDGNLLDPTKSDSVAYAIRQFNHHAARSPRSAVMYLIQNKEKIAKNLEVEDIDKKKAKQWEGFLNYYSGSSKESKRINSTSSTNSVEDDFEFDF